VDGAASGCGGGIYINTAQPTISNNDILRNAAAFMVPGGTGVGGGIYVINSGGTIIDANQIHLNDSHIDGEGFGGGIALVNSGGKISIRNNHIYDNETFRETYSDHNGHAIYVLSNTGGIEILNNQINNNNPNNGDHYHFQNTIVTQHCDYRCRFEGNQIYDNHGSGAMRLRQSSTTILRNTIINPDETVGIDVWATDMNPHDPGVFALIANNIIASNTVWNVIIDGTMQDEAHVQFVYNTLADSQCGLYIYSPNEESTVSFDRGIVSGQSVYGICKLGDVTMSITISNNLFHGNVDDGLTGTDPLSGDPSYVDPAGGDYHILSTSAAINTVTDGSLAEDIDGDIRPMGIGTTPFDVGADEFWWKFFLPVLHKP
jgi:hypothetical protein